jgi:hypothetical protein
MPTMTMTPTCRHTLAASKLRWKTPLIVIAITILSGCANYQAVKPGTSVAEVLQKFGKPSTECTRADGTRRLIWTTQPAGQYAWGTNTTPEGTIVGFQQLLTDAHFQVLSTGRWTAKDVSCEFGEPANKNGIAKGREIVWAYRYKQEEVWDSMMYVYMGSDGDLANRFHPGPDPDTLRGDGRLF